MTSLSHAGALGAAAILAAATPALAHVAFETGQAPAGSTYRAVLVVPHGCGGQPTLKIRVRIPEGVVAVTPLPKAGWILETSQGTYAKPYELEGETVPNGVTEIVWSGSLPDRQSDTFVFQARLTDAFRPGATVSFPVIQECADAREDWTEVPAAGQDAQQDFRGLRKPAPGVTVVAGAAGPVAATFRAGPLVVEQPWSRVTPAGAKVGGGYVRITNTGSEPDRLVGGTVPIAGRVEVHGMSMTGDVVRMSPVEGGLEIKPGETVELKPGGLHLMFVDLKEPLKEGQTVKGTLLFQKAGPVAVEYEVRGMGARQDGQVPAEHHH